MLKELLPLIPPHDMYVEPFVGGGALFWAKEPSRVEVINDTNAEVINFYHIVKTKFHSLQRMIRTTLHSRLTHCHAQVIYDTPDLFSPLQRAWAFWVLANQSFSSIIGGGWGYANDISIPKRLTNKREDFTDHFSKRLELVQIECNDALKIIKARD